MGKETVSPNQPDSNSSELHLRNQDLQDAVEEYKEALNIIIEKHAEQMVILPVRVCFEGLTPSHS